MSNSRRDGPTGFEAISEIGKRLGELSSMLKDAMSQAGDAGERSGQRTFTIETPQGPLTGTAGYSVRFGAAGPARPGRPPAARAKASDVTVETAREPTVDVHDEGDRVVVTAELPGVEIEDVSVHLGDGVLVIETHGARRFRSVVNLPDAVQAATLQSVLRNGILEVVLDKAA